MWQKFAKIIAHLRCKIMSVEVKVEEWLRKMGYDGEVPSSLSKICGPSFAFIWEQLITNVKPKQEVELKRKNIIVDRLSKKPLEKQDEFSYPIKEIQIFAERQRLEKRVKCLENHVDEKQKMIDEALKLNKMTYVKIDNIKARIKENQEKKFLLEKKSKLIEEDIQRAQEALTLARNLTPVEMDANANGDEITKTLQKCAEKLQKLSEGISLPKTKTNRSLSTSFSNFGKTPYSSKMNTFSRFLNQSTTLTDMVPSSKKHNNSNKENHLLQDPAIHRCLKFSDSDNKEIKVGKNPKRESLGILPDECLNISDEIDALLSSPAKTEHSFLQPLSDSIFEPSTNYEFLEKLQGDKNVAELLKNLLHKNNRYLILIHCKNMYEQLLRDIRGPLMDCNTLMRTNRSISQADLTKLYFIHAKSELQEDKSQAALKKLQEIARKRKEEILSQLSNRAHKDEIKLFELQIEEAYLKGANNFLQIEIMSSKKVESGNELQVVTFKIKQAKEEVGYKCDCIKNLIGNIFKILKDIKQNREETSTCVRRLSPYIHDLSWTDAMTKEVNFQEIDLFKKFPLEYNRKFKANFFRNIGDTTVPPYVALDSNNLAMLTMLMDLPFMSAENVIFNALRTKVTANMLRLQPQMELPDLVYKTYSREELSRREEYVAPVMKKLNSVINSSSVKEVLSGPNYMKEVADLWIEMPFKNFISDKRLVEGRDYKFYEKILEELSSS